jgi:hypothetical protein
MVIFVYISKHGKMGGFEGLWNAGVWAKESPTFNRGKLDFGLRKIR